MTEENLQEKYQLRPLTRGELKALRKKGFNLTTIDKLDAQAQDEFVDLVNETVMGIEAAGDLPVAEGIRVFAAIVNLTFERDVKNLLTPGTGTGMAAPSAVGPAGRKTAKRARPHRPK